jgi:cyclopropane-fatty-acyl-phospholipid synthase
MGDTRTSKQRSRNPLAMSSRSHTPVLGVRKRPASTLARWLLGEMLRSLGNPPVALVPWDGEPVTAPDGGPPQIRLHFRDPGAMIRLALDPEYQFGELYSSGRIDVEGDLVALIEYIQASQGIRQGIRSRLLSRVHPPRSNLPGRSTSNIHHHYDIGNDFYRLWLDQQLVYTCAYFPTPSAGLEEAQVAKMDHVCRKLRLRQDESVVEAGCGWGALALHMAREYGVRVRAYNLSGEQIAHARQRARSEGLDSRVEFVEADYRAIEGQYDVFVSVGMLEHVGRRHYRDLGAVVDRCIGRQGRGLLHSIGTDYSAPLNPWIEHRIFPGAYPPTLGEMMKVFETAAFSVLDVENLRLHYAKTLEHWLARYDLASGQVEAMFGQEFVRAWRLYLAGSLAAFRSGKLQLFQVLFQRHGDAHIPWTRAYLYADEDRAWRAATS